MKTSKLLITASFATVLLGSLVTSARARNLSNSSQTTRALWTLMNLRGGFGTIECEVLLSGSYHTRTITKTVGSLIGYITEARFLRCRRGGATINGTSLPWHRRYNGFVGTLPRIDGVEETITGAEWTFREPFGITCTVRRESSSTILADSVSAGVVTSVGISGTSPCGEFTIALGGRTTNVSELGGARVTITLI